MRCVVLVPQLRTALKKEVYDEELDAGIQAWGEENRKKLGKGLKNVAMETEVTSSLVLK